MHRKKALTIKTWDCFLTHCTVSRETVKIFQFYLTFHSSHPHPQLGSHWLDPGVADASSFLCHKDTAPGSHQQHVPVTPDSRHATTPHCVTLLGARAQSFLFLTISHTETDGRCRCHRRGNIISCNQRFLYECSQLNERSVFCDIGFKH